MILIGSKGDFFLFPIVATDTVEKMTVTEASERDHRDPRTNVLPLTNADYSASHTQGWVAVPTPTSCLTAMSLLRLLGAGSISAARDEFPFLLYFWNVYGSPHPISRPAFRVLPKSNVDLETNLYNLTKELKVKIQDISHRTHKTSPKVALK